MKLGKTKFSYSKDACISASYKTATEFWFLTLIAAMIINPWFGKAADKIETVNGTSAIVRKASTKNMTRVGKWGELTLTPIIISPPLELVSIDRGAIRQTTWYFPNADAEKVFKMLRESGVATIDASQLRTRTQSAPQIKGVILTPDPAWVRTLTPEVRARVYAILAKCDLNMAQAYAFRHPGTNPEAWLNSSLISPHTLQLVEPLLFRNGDFMMFSDMELVRAEIYSDEELRHLSKALLQQPTVIASPSVNHKSDLDALIKYWGRGGRGIKIRPLIESAAKGGEDRTIDVIHLLPQFVQEHLYSYPTFSTVDLNRSSLVDCLWTSLNFFLPQPDDRFLDASVALKTLQEDYFIIETDFKLGDIVTLVDNKGTVIQAAVYVAGDILFGKNGISSMEPWTLMPIEKVKEYYKWNSENLRIIVHRWKNL